MSVNHYIGLDVHKKSVSYCVKRGDGQIVGEGKLPATKWMSGPADAWTPMRTARRQTVARTQPTTALQGTLFRRQREISVFPWHIPIMDVTDLDPSPPASSPRCCLRRAG